MSHFSAAEWFEFARDSISPAAKSLMQQHLEEGCAGCRRESALWAEVLDISGRETNYQAPEAVVQSLKALFKPGGSWKWLSQVAETATLLFDSFRESFAEATRGAGASSRQLLQESKPFVIDLRVESEPARNQVRFIGQVLNSNEPTKGVQDAEIFLLNGEQLVARTKSNALGEFHLESKAEQGLQLFIDVRGQKVIEVRLSNLLGESHGTT